jgi:hypothetical protein
MGNILNSVPVHRGIGVHWAVQSTTVSGAGTFKLQSTDHTLQAATDMVQDGSGFTVNKTYYDFSESATLECVITGTNGTGNVSPTLAEPSDIITITDSVYTQLAGTDWLVDSVSVKRSNTSAMRVTYNLTRYPLITS